MTIIRQVTSTAPNTNTTKDFTISGFGAVQAAIFFFSSVANGSWVNDGSMCIGFYDGAYQGCCGYGIENAQDPDNNQTQKFSSGSLVGIYRVDTGSERRTVSIDSVITDGLRLNFAGDDPAVEIFVTCIFIKGATAVKAGFDTADTVDTNEKNIATTGCNPDLVIMAARTSNTETSNSAMGRFSVGFAYDTGSGIDQRCKGLRYNNGDPNDWNAHVSGVNAINLDTSGTGTIVGGEIVSMGTAEFRIKNNGGSASTGFFYLAIEMSEDVLVWDDLTPTTGQDYDPFSSSFQPQWVFMVPTAETVINTNNSGDQRVVEEFGLYSVIDNNPGSGSTEESGHYIIHENGSAGVGSTFSQSRYDNRLEVNGVTGIPGAENLLEGDLPTFDSSGIVYANANFNHDSTARLLLGFAVEEEQIAGGEVINRVLTESTIITDPAPGTILRQRIPGDRVELLSDGVFLYTALGRLLFDNFEVADAISLRKIIDDQLTQVSDLTDALDIMRQVFRQVSEAIAVGDNITTAIALARVTSDSLSLTDNDIQLLERGRLTQDSLDLNDLFNKIVTVGESTQTFIVLLEEILSVFDTSALSFHGTNNREFADTISIGESLALMHARNRVALSEAGIIDSALANAVRHRQSLDFISNADTIVPVRRRIVDSADSFDISDLTESIKIQARLVIDTLVIDEDILVDRTAILNSNLNTDSILLLDFMFVESGTLLPPADICIEHGIQNQ